MSCKFRNSTLIKYFFGIIIIFGTITIANGKSYPDATPHICDAFDESSEECYYIFNTYNGRSKHLKTPSSFPVKYTLYNYRMEEFHFTFENSISKISKVHIPGATWKILIHGFLNNPDTSFPVNVRSAYQQRMIQHPEEKYNVLVVDWSEGACASLSIYTYHQAAHNVKFVAFELGRLLHRFYRENILDSNTDLHIIGHSLGAHIAGHTSFELEEYFGESKIWRVSALDPAGPAFWQNIFPGDTNKYHYERLDVSEAVILDVYHTSNLLGTDEQVGTIDFYINGGKDQKSCDIEFKTPIFGFRIPIFVFRTVLQICSHNYATDVFAQSINDLNMTACFECNSYEEFINHKCTCDRLIFGEHLLENRNMTVTRTGKAFIDTPKDTSVSSNYIQMLRKYGFFGLLRAVWNMFCH